MSRNRPSWGAAGALQADLRHYLQQSRDALVASLDGLSEHDVRRPLVPSGTNLLGLVKHLAGLELSYLGDCVGRPAGITLPWVEDDSIWEGADMWATPEESREGLLGLYRSAWAHTDATLAALGPDAPAHVPWWPEERRATTLGHLLARMVAETAQHAGHADLCRELVDGGTATDHGETAEQVAAYTARIQAAADAFR